MEFSEKLLAWYPNHKRDLPWRNISNPYHIWLSEIILQQTRVKQGLPYYEAFVEKFPTIQDLADAPEETVMRTWQGLGYYSRARNMHATAKIIATDLQGIFPQTKADLIKLKGIGEYTASAIASFAFGERVAVVDGNVFRVLARFFGLEADISSPKGVKRFQELALMLLPADHVNTYNQAIMEFGALQCTPQKPNCMFCPLQANCLAYAEDRQDVLPIKTQKIKQKERYFHYLVLKQGEKIAMHKRELGDIWAGLYDFVGQAGKEAIDLEAHYFFQQASFDFVLRYESPYLKHQLTHQTLFVKFWVLEIGEGQSVDFQENNCQWYDLEEVKALPKPILLANFVEKQWQ